MATSIAKIANRIWNKTVALEPIDVTRGVPWRDMEADQLKAFFQQWEITAVEADADALSGVQKHYNEGYRDAILDLTEAFGMMTANLPEPVLDLDGWHK